MEGWSKGHRRIKNLKSEENAERWTNIARRRSLQYDRGWNMHTAIIAEALQVAMDCAFLMSIFKKSIKLR